MKGEDEIKQLLADRGGNVTTTGGAKGAVKIRIRAERSLLREILELDDDQALCTECLAVEDEDEDWALPRLCDECGDHVQTRIGQTS